MKKLYYYILLNALLLSLNAKTEGVTTGGTLPEEEASSRFHPMKAFKEDPSFIPPSELPVAPAPTVAKSSVTPLEEKVTLEQAPPSLQIRLQYWTQLVKYGSILVQEVAIAIKDVTMAINGVKSALTIQENPTQSPSTPPASQKNTTETTKPISSSSPQVTTDPKAPQPWKDENWAKKFNGWA